MEITTKLEALRKQVLAGAKKYDDWHNLPADTGVYAIWIKETGQLYIGATMKKPMISKGHIYKFGIYDRISHHLTNYPKYSKSKIAKVMEKVKKGELTAIYYVLALVTDEQMAQNIENQYIQILKPELNEKKKSNIQVSKCRAFTAEEQKYISIEKIEPTENFCLDQSIYLINNNPNLKQLKIFA